MSSLALYRRQKEMLKAGYKNSESDSTLGAFREMLHQKCKRNSTIFKFNTILFLFVLFIINN
jgi:hypothetical protein